MSHSTIDGLIGLILFATGLLALYAVKSPTPDANEPVDTRPVSATSTRPAPIRGVGREVQQALKDTGQAEMLGEEEMSQIPPEVAKALIENAVVLTVPVEGNP